MDKDSRHPLHLTSYQTSDILYDNRTSYMPKTKISVTVDSTLVEKVDQLDIDASRSEIVQMALERWLRNQRVESLERAIEEYYREVTKDEQKEDAEWAALSASAIDETWK
jgi:metal-responsive CopG/Arc/MetJ family transcriptional regulator